MTARSRSTQGKLPVLQLAEELDYASKACKIMGYHRETFYEVQEAFKIGGVSALVELRRGPRHPHRNRVPEAVDERILVFCLVQLTYGANWVAKELRLTGVDVSSSDVRCVWLPPD